MYAYRYLKRGFSTLNLLQNDAIDGHSEADINVCDRRACCQRFHHSCSHLFLLLHITHSQELEAASRSSETYLAENGGGRPASVQPRSIRVQEGTGQNYLARTHGNGYVTDKPRMMMMKRHRSLLATCTVV